MDQGQPRPPDQNLWRGAGKLTLQTTFARFLIDQGADPAALVTDPAALTARFISYAGGADPETLLSALIAQFTLVDLGITAQRGTKVDVVYRGAGGLVLGCELLAWDDVGDDARVAALLDHADSEDALTAGVLTRSRVGEIVVAGQRVPLKPIAVEAVRVDRSAVR